MPEYPYGERRSDLFASTWAYLGDAVEMNQAEGNERVADYIENVLMNFICREVQAAMVQEGKAKLATFKQEEAPSG